MIRRTLLLVGWTFLWCGPLQGQTPDPPPPSLTVSGSGEVSADPDIAVLRLGIESQAATAREAQIETNRVANAILDTLGALGIPSRDIQTAQLRLYPVYEADRPGPQERPQPRLVGYRAANTVSVELADLARIGSAVDAAIGAGANRVDGLELGLRDDAGARERALTAAVEDARAKAAAIAGALGARLLGVLEVNEQGVSVPLMRLRDAGGFVEMQESTPVSTGQITVTAAIMVRYRLETPPEDPGTPH